MGVKKPIEVDGHSGAKCLWPSFSVAWRELEDKAEHFWVFKGQLLVSLILSLSCI